MTVVVIVVTTVSSTRYVVSPPFVPSGTAGPGMVVVPVKVTSVGKYFTRVISAA